jgi:hypothetical protein
MDGRPVVGIELARANCRWRVTNLALSVARWVHNAFEWLLVASSLALAAVWFTRFYSSLEQKNETELIFAKLRNGPTGLINLVFLSQSDQVREKASRSRSQNQIDCDRDGISDSERPVLRSVQDAVERSCVTLDAVFPLIAFQFAHRLLHVLALRRAQFAPSPFRKKRGG